MGCLWTGEFYILCRIFVWFFTTSRTRLRVVLSLWWGRSTLGLIEMVRWAFGILVYEMLTGISPFGSESDDYTNVYNNVLHNKLRIPSDIRGSTKRLIEELLVMFQSCSLEKESCCWLELNRLWIHGAYTPLEQLEPHFICRHKNYPIQQIL